MQHEGRPAREHHPVVGRRIPGEDLRRHGLLVERSQELRARRSSPSTGGPAGRRRPARSRRTTRGGRAAPCSSPSPGRDPGPPDCRTSAVILRPPTRRSSQVLGAVRISDLAPEVDPVVARIRHEGVGEREVLSGLRIVRRLLRERDHLAVALLDLVHDLPVIDDLVLVGGRRRDEEEEVVSLPRRRLGRAAGVDLRRGHVVHDHVGPVLRAPLLRVDAVEPRVVARDEVAPLQDPQRLLRRRRLPVSPARAGEDRHGARRERRPRRLHESAPGYPGAPFRRHSCLSSVRRLDTARARENTEAQVYNRGPWPLSIPDRRSRRSRSGTQPASPRPPDRRDALRGLQDDVSHLRARLALPRAHSAASRRKAASRSSPSRRTSRRKPGSSARRLGTRLETVYDPCPWKASERARGHQRSDALPRRRRRRHRGDPRRLRPRALPRARAARRGARRQPLPRLFLPSATTLPRSSPAEALATPAGSRRQATREHQTTDSRRAEGIGIQAARRQGGAAREPPPRALAAARTRSRASTATSGRSCPRSTTPSSRSTTSSCWACAARPRRASSACSSTSSTRDPGDRGQRAQRGPLRADHEVRPARPRRDRATRRRSTGSRARSATARSSRRPTSRSPT